MTRGATSALALTLLLTLALVPTAAAADDPQITVPDPSPVADAAEATAQATAGDALKTHQENEAEVHEAIGKLQTATVPFSNVNNVVTNTGDLLVRTIQRTGALANTAAAWTGDEAREKVHEANATANAAQSSTGGAGSVAVGVLDAAWAVLCRDGHVANNTDPTDPAFADDNLDCDDGSVLGEALGQGNETAAQAGAAAHGQELDEVDAAVADLEDFLCGGCLPDL